jgi:cytochrome c biogenesis factor
MLTFASLVFLSALTRGGFTQSVHSYAVSAIGPVMLSFAVAMMGLFFYFAKGKKKPLFRLEVERSSLTSRSSFLSFWALISISIVCLIGLAFSGFAYSYFTYPFVLLFVISLVGLSLGDKTHYARQFLIVVVALIVGVALSAIGLQSVNVLVTLVVPLLTVTFAALLYRIVKTARGKSPLWQCLFGLAVVVMLLGVFFSSGAKTSNTLTDVETNTLLETLNLTVVVTHVEISNSTSEVFNSKVSAVIPEYSTVTADIEIHDSGTLYSGSVSASFYPNYGLIIEPLIVSTPVGDVYVHFEYTESLYNALTQQLTGNSTTPNNVALTVQKNPLIYFVWTGIILMVVFRCAELAVDLYQSTIEKSRQPKLMCNK